MNLENRTVFFKSFGCRTNQEETTELHAALGRDGFTVVDRVEDAALIVINTCSVTAHAESKINRYLLSLGREAPEAAVLLTGCMAQQRREELFRFPNVQWIVGNASKADIPAIVGESGRAVFLREFEAVPLAVAVDHEPPGSAGRTRLHLKIQEGCNRRCAYCIVPFLRGPSRSASPDEIESSVRSALVAGYREIVLTGTHIGQFGGAGGVHALIDRLLAVDGDFRLRLSSIDGEEVSPHLLSLAGPGEKLCDHLHVSLQSLSPEVLKLMGRPFRSIETMAERLANFRSHYPFAGLGADFIVGFPGETDAMFEETLERASAIGFSYAHIFRFSRRPGTAAATMPGEPPEKVKLERSERLRQVIAAAGSDFISRHRGKQVRILVEGSSPVRGLTSNYLTVEVADFSSSANPLPNSWLNVIIDGTASYGRSCTAHIPPM